MIYKSDRVGITVYRGADDELNSYKINSVQEQSIRKDVNAIIDYMRKKYNLEDKYILESRYYDGKTREHQLNALIFRFMDVCNDIVGDVIITFDAPEYGYVEDESGNKKWQANHENLKFNYIFRTCIDTNFEDIVDYNIVGKELNKIIRSLGLKRIVKAYVGSHYSPTYKIPTANVLIVYNKRDELNIGVMDEFMKKIDKIADDYIMYTFERLEWY